MLNAALSIIHDEHRSLAAVIHGLRYLLREMRERNVPADFKVLWAMIFYLDQFPEKMHHPKENAYLFKRLCQRTSAADKVVADLEQQHIESVTLVRDLEQALGQFEAGLSDGLDRFLSTAEIFAQETLRHMALEETVVIPLARKHLTTEDWIEIAVAFGENGDPRFDAATDHQCRDLFSRIVNLAPPPIGVGPSRRR